MTDPLWLTCYHCRGTYDFLAADNPSLMLCRPCLDLDRSEKSPEAVKVKQLPLL